VTGRLRLKIIGFESHTLANVWIMSYTGIESKARTRHLFIIKDRIKAKNDGPTTEDEVRMYGSHSKRLLVYAACLNSAMIDFESSLREAGMYKHGLKRNLNRVSGLVQKISSALYKGVAKKISEDFCRLYNDVMEDSIFKIDGNILVKQPEKSYNIVMSLIRLTLKENNSIGRFKQMYITALEIAPKMLECGLKDYNLDIAIERALDEVALP
jgi:hypothetical protein